MDCTHRFHIRNFDIEDDNFTFDRGRAKRLMHLIIENFGEGGLELSAMNGISFSSLDRELLTLMKKAGFKTINLSFVSTDPSFKKRMGRPGTTNEFDHVLEDAEQTGLNVIAYAIIGIPDQRIQEMVNEDYAKLKEKVAASPL